MDEAGKAKTVEELAALIGGRVSGDAQIGIEHVASIGSATVGAVAFVEDRKALESTQDCAASALIVPDGAGERAREVARKVPAIIEASKPKLAFALIAKALHPQKRREPCSSPHGGHWRWCEHRLNRLHWPTCLHRRALNYWNGNQNRSGRGGR